MEDLIDDLSSKFISAYKPDDKREDVQNYPTYFLGSIILSLKGNRRSIIYGQQRLTSITLLLIYLNNLQSQRSDKVNISDLIFSEKYAQKTFNLQIDDRGECFDSLYKNQDFDKSGKSESVKNIVDRFKEIGELFPPELSGDTLPFFIDWFIDNVIFVEINTHSDKDAYLIFETMNDRGLSLTSTEMIKGYLISQIENEVKKNELNGIWKSRILELKTISKDEDLEFFKSWLRAKYAETIRESRKGAENEDFENIARFHSWVKENLEKLGLQNKDDFYKFVKEKFEFYSRLYIEINKASKETIRGLEHLRYISITKFATSFYSPLLLAPINISDDELTVNKNLHWYQGSLKLLLYVDL